MMRFLPYISALTIMIALCHDALASSVISTQQQKMIEKFQNMSPQEMEAQMQAAQKASQCMGNVNQEKLQGLQARGEALNQKIDALCAAGKDKEANRISRTEGRRLVNDPTVKKMRRCTKDMVALFDFPDPDKHMSESVCN